MKKVLSLVLCLMMVLSLAAAAHADDQVTINFYCNPSKNGGVEAAVAAFEAANPGIHVEIVEFSSDTNQKKTTLSSIFQAQDDSADVFMMDCVFYTFIGLLAGIITDLSYGFLDPRIRMGAR